MKRLAFLLALAAPLALFPSVPRVAQAEELPTAEALLDAIDANLTFESRTSTATMTVVTPKRTRVYQMQTFGRGSDEAAIEYLAPSRDKGTKMLRQGDDMWIYMPSTERTQKISGHMLRQGMMGSDMSYEDMMDAGDLRSQYGATLTGTEAVSGVACWKLELKANDNSVSYPKRLVWLDKVDLIPLKQELFALSGKKLKTWWMSDVQSFEGGRRFPLTMAIEDHLKKGSKTTIKSTAVHFGVELEEEVFSRRWLERK